MKLSTLATAGLFGAVAMVSTAALADGHGKGKRGHGGAKVEQMFQNADANGDNVLTHDEMLASVAARFAAVDTDGNGQISREERQAMRAARQAERFAALDTDGNGALSEAEMKAHAEGRMANRIARRIERADANGDGQISLEEMQAQRQMRGEGRGGKRGGMRGEHGEGGRGGEHGEGGRGGERGEGRRGGKRGGMRGERIGTIAGMEARALRMFDRLDADRDGYVTRFEVTEAMNNRGKGGKGGKGNKDDNR